METYNPSLPIAFNFNTVDLLEKALFVVFKMSDKGVGEEVELSDQSEFRSKDKSAVLQKFATSKRILRNSVAMVLLVPKKLICVNYTKKFLFFKIERVNRSFSSKAIKNASLEFVLIKKRIHQNQNLSD